MRRLLGVLTATLLALLFVVPVAFAADPNLPHTGRVLISIGGDATLPAGDHADAVIVVNGTARISGEANTVVVVDGAANFTAARAETIVAISSPVNLGPGTVVLGDVRTLNADITRDPSATVSGTVGDLSADIAALGLVLAGAFVLIWLGIGLTTIVAALVVAALGARQLRAAETLISREPGSVLVTGLVGIVLTPIVAVLAMMTIIGVPVGFAILAIAWPFVSFIGYVFAAVWVGDFVLSRVGNRPPSERPYLASIVGVIILTVLGLVPILSAIATLFGFGAVLMLAWRTFRGQGSMPAVAPGHVPAAMGA